MARHIDRVRQAMWGGRSGIHEVGGARSLTQPRAASGEVGFTTRRPGRGMRGHSRRGWRR